jgi:TldD protein
MKPITRRAFLKAAALSTGALAANQILPGGWWVAAAAKQSPGYFESEFGITDALCNRVIQKALARGGDFADLYFEHTIRNSLFLEDGQVNQAYGRIDLGVGVRTVKGDQVGYGFTQVLDEKSMLSAAATAATIADAAARPKSKQFIRPAVADYYPLKTLLTQVPLDAKLPLIRLVHEQCLKHSGLVITVQAGLVDQQKRVLIVRSDGQKAEDLLPLDYLYARVVVEKGGRREKASWNLGGRRDFSWFTPEVAAELAQGTTERALRLLEAIQPPAGEMPVVLGPGTTGILLHEAIGHGFEADFNRKKISVYCTLLEQKVAEPFVTIIDDATLPSQTGSLNVDDEGTPGQKTVLIENGVVRSYLHDRISARHYGVEPTGNGRRQSYQHYPLPRMRTTYLLPGPAEPEEVIRSVVRGIYVAEVGNGQVKIGEGDFAFYVTQGYLIENGKLTAPIKDVNIMGNGPKMLKNVAMIGNDLKFSRGGSGSCSKEGQNVPISFGLPTVLVNSLTVGGLKA